MNDKDQNEPFGGEATATHSLTIYFDELPDGRTRFWLKTDDEVRASRDIPVKDLVDEGCSLTFLATRLLADRLLQKGCVEILQVADWLLENNRGVTDVSESDLEPAGTGTSFH
jgi:hypothetical protein